MILAAHDELRLPAHQVTTRNFGAAYPFVAEAGLGSRGVLIGRDLLGGAFVFDPFHLYDAGVVSNPNMVVFGQIGRGKSALMKTYLWRQAVFGRRSWVVDPKGEYSGLARAWGVAPIALRPGGAVRLNPLDQPHGEDTRGARRAEVLASLVASCLGRPVSPRERAAMELALDEADRVASPATLPAVVSAMLDPTDAAARTVRMTRAALADDARDAALELRRLVQGDLAGMFDDVTTSGLDLGGPLVVLDLSALYNSAALGVLMACATAWLQATLAERLGSSTGSSASTRDKVIIVVDEAWAVLSNVAVARWLQASWKLSRAYGVSNVAVLHRVSDLHAVGASDSEQVSLAKGLLADSETRIVYAQPPGELSPAADLLSLSSTECELLPQLRRGVGLWKVANRSFLVQHRIAPGEKCFVDTDAAMRG